MVFTLSFHYILICTYLHILFLENKAFPKIGKKLHELLLAAVFKISNKLTKSRGSIFDRAERKNVVQLAGNIKKLNLKLHSTFSCTRLFTTIDK